MSYYLEDIKMEFLKRWKNLQPLEVKKGYPGEIKFQSFFF